MATDVYDVWSFADRMFPMRRPIGVAGESRVDENGDTIVSVRLGAVRPSAEKLAEPTPTKFKVGDLVRVKDESELARGVPSVSGKSLTVAAVGLCKPYEYVVALDAGCWYAPGCDLELVSNDDHVDTSFSWRGAPSGRADYTFALKIDYGVSDTFTHPVDAEVTIHRSTPWEPFHGRSAKVVRVDADGTHHVKVEGFDRETYRFDADELKAVAPKEVAKPRNQQPREPSLISWATEDGCNSIASSLRRDRVRELARELFASNHSVLSFIERVGDFSVRSIHSRSVHIISDARFQNAIRTAWNRNEGGLRTACVKQAMRIVDERGGK